MVTLETLFAFGIVKPSDEKLDKLICVMFKEDIAKIKHIKEYFSLDNMHLITPLIKHSGDCRISEFYKLLPEDLKPYYEEGLQVLYKDYEVINR